jgi:hypothetical protein
LSQSLTLSPKINPNLLQRSEVVALFNTLHRVSESLDAVETFRKMYAETQASELQRVAAIPVSHRMRLYVDCTANTTAVTSRKPIRRYLSMGTVCSRGGEKNVSRVLRPLLAAINRYINLITS